MSIFFLPSRLSILGQSPGLILSPSLARRLLSLPIFLIASMSAIADKVTGLSDTQSSAATNIVPVCVGLNTKASGNDDISVRPTTAQIASLSPQEQDLLRRCADAIEAGGLGLPDNAARATDETNEAAKTALAQIAPDEISAQGTTSVRAVNVQQDNVAARISALQAGFRGLDLGHLALNLDGVKLSGREFLNLTGGAAGDESRHSGLGMFLNGRFNLGDKDATGREAGFDFNGTGVTLGMDQFIARNAFIGAALGYNRTAIDVENNGGALDTDSVSFSLYGSYFRSDQFYLNGFLEYAKDDHNTRRNLNYTLNETSGGCCDVDVVENKTVTVDQAAIGDSDGNQLTVAMDIGYEIPKGATTITPTAAIAYTRVNIDAFDEHMSRPNDIGQGLALHIGDQEITSTKSELGVHLNHASSREWGVFTQQLKVSWLHEFENDGRIINAHYLFDPNQVSMDLKTEDADADYFAVNLGISAGMAKGKSAYLSYNSLLGLDGITFHGINVGYRMEF